VIRAVRALLAAILVASLAGAPASAAPLFSCSVDLNERSVTTEETWPVATPFHPVPRHADPACDEPLGAGRYTVTIARTQNGVGAFRVIVRTDGRLAAWVACHASYTEGALFEVTSMRCYHDDVFPVYGDSVSGRFLMEIDAPSRVTFEAGPVGHGACGAPGVCAAAWIARGTVSAKISL
jgi:hypothetical protein